MCIAVRSGCQLDSVLLDWLGWGTFCAIHQVSPPEADENLDLEDEEDEFADYQLDNPILGAQELLRFARVKEMLQAG